MREYGNYTDELTKDIGEFIEEQFEDELINRYEELIEDTGADTEYLPDSFDFEDYVDEILRAIEDDDNCITGNADGSYYGNSYKAREAVNEVLWYTDIANIFYMMGYKGIPIELGAEDVDVIIRCGLLALYKQEIVEDWIENWLDDKNTRHELERADL